MRIKLCKGTHYNMNKRISAEVFRFFRVLLALNLWIIRLLFVTLHQNNLKRIVIMNIKHLLTTAAAALCMLTATAQSQLYPKHFNLNEVTLLDGPMKTAMDKNIEMLLQYDTDRLLTPFVRQSGLAQTTDKTSPYYQWLTKHPNFRNWGGDAGFDLSGHVGGHYVSALALAYAACHDEAVRTQLKERLDYMINVMKDCQDAYDDNTTGLYGFIGGQPINESWEALQR